MASAYIVRKVRLPDGRWVRRTPGARTGGWPESETELRRCEKRWHVHYRLGGRGSRTRHAGAFKEERAARERLRLVQAELAAGRVPNLQVTRTGEATIEQAVRDYVAHRAGSEAQDSRGNRANAIKRLGALGGVLVEAATWRDFSDWIAANDALKVSTRRQYMSVYRRALDHADIAPNPARDRRVEFPFEPQEEIQPPSWNEMRLIEEHLLRRPARGRPSRYGPIVQFIEGTGLRASEAMNLLRKDVDLARRRIRVSGARTKNRTGGQRWVPITRELEPVLEVFGSASGDPGDRLLGWGWTTDGLYKALLRACEALGFETVFGPHDLRHRYISRLVLANVNMRIVQEVAGHRNLTSIQRTYSHVLLDEPAESLLELHEAVMRLQRS
jgi:integrase/recombinase XerD